MGRKLTFAGEGRALSVTERIRRSGSLRAWAIGALTVSVFALDLTLPKGYSVWALYLVPLLLTAWLPFRWLPIVLVSTCTTLVILRFSLPLSVVPQWVSAANRAFGVAVMWVVALLLVSRRRAESALQEQTRLLRAVLDSVADGVVVADEAGRLVLFNRGAKDQHGGLPMNGLPFREWPGHYGLYLPDQRTPYPPEALPLMRAVRGESVDNAEVFVRNEGVPEGRWALVSGRPIIDEAGRPRGGVIVRRDVTERKIAERRLAAQYAVTGILAESAGTADTIGRVLRVLCDSLGWDLGAYWTVDAQAGLLRCEVLWWQGSDGAPTFEGTSRQATRLPGAGLPGRVWQTGRPAWVPDVHADEGLVRGTVVSPDRLHGALAFPVQWERRVLGVFDLLSREPRLPDAELLKMLESVGSQIGQFLVRKRAEEERERLIGELREALAKVKTLKGLLPLCSSCQKVRDARGTWRELEDLVCEQSEASFRQDLCPSCAEILFPGFYKRWNKYH